MKIFLNENESNLWEILMENISPTGTGCVSIGYLIKQLGWYIDEVEFTLNSLIRKGILTGSFVLDSSIKSEAFNSFCFQICTLLWTNEITWVAEQWQE